MRILATLLTAVLVASTACAGSSGNPCRVESLPTAKAACLELQFEQHVLRMSQQIDHVLSRLQAATASQLLALGQQYETAQSNWFEQLRSACTSRHPDDPVGFQNCRLGAVANRTDRLSLSLQRAAEDFGAPIDYEVAIPDSVEILIPLPVEVPFDGEARLPLLVPIEPN